MAALKGNGAANMETNKILSEDAEYQINVRYERSPNIPPSPFGLSFNRLLLSLQWITYTSYLKIRYRQALELNHWILWSLLTLEIFAKLPTFMSQLAMLVASFGKRPSRKGYELIGDHVPRVSIFITCCGEDPDIVLDTLRSAATQEYPSNRYQIFVLDDAAMPEMSAMVQRYSAENLNAPKVNYLARKKTAGVPHYNKSGNLRFGFEESNKLFPSPYVGSLDADSVVDKLWLRRALPHLLLDSKLDLINVRGRTYNEPPGDPLHQGFQSSTSWARSDMDSLGTISCYGSCYITRRSAIEEIGGWPKVNSGEDLMLGFTLLGEGRISGVCGDTMEWNLASDSIDSLVVQRERWVDSDLNLLHTFRFFIPGLDPGKHRNIGQTIWTILDRIHPYTIATDMAILALMPLLLYTAISRNVMVAGNFTDLAVPKAYLAYILLDKFIGLRIFGELSGQSNTVYWLIWYSFKRLVLFHLPWTQLGFIVTGATRSSYNECSQAKRSPLKTRFMSGYCFPFICYSAFTAYVLWDGIHKVYSSKTAKTTSPSAAYGYYTASFVWLLEICVKMTEPARYMLWPPNMPDRKVLLRRALNDKRFCSGPPKILDNSEHADKEYEESRGSKMPLLEKVRSFPWLDLLQLSIVFLVDWSPMLFG